MKRKTRSILEELNRFANERDTIHDIETQATNVVASVENLKTLINESFTAEESTDLIKRLMNSIKTNDPSKFNRGIRSIKKLNENKRHSGH